MWRIDHMGVVPIYYFGGYFNGPTYKLKGQIAEVIGLRANPTTPIAQRIEGYLANKWGLTLVSGHPYKSTPPTV